MWRHTTADNERLSDVVAVKTIKSMHKCVITVMYVSLITM